MRAPLLIAILALFTVTQLSAKVARIEFSKLIAISELIVVATVDSVGFPIGKRYARATVKEVWKGTNLSKVEFLASPTWTCDISEAKKGETVLLFLTQSKKSRSYAIAHSGRGRMPLRTIAGKRCATFWPGCYPSRRHTHYRGPRAEVGFHPVSRSRHPSRLGHESKEGTRRDESMRRCPPCMHRRTSCSPC